MSKSNFKVGDVVHHVQYERGVVKKTAEVTYPVYVSFDNGENGWFSDEVLSFSPWPAPDHKRPIQDGWWVVAIEGYPDDPCVRLVKGKDVFTHPNRCTRDTSQYEFIRYLGKDWRTAE